MFIVIQLFHVKGSNSTAIIEYGCSVFMNHHQKTIQFIVLDLISLEHCYLQFILYLKLAANETGFMLVMVHVVVGLHIDIECEPCMDYERNLP